MVHRVLKSTIVRTPALRWPIEVPELIVGQTLLEISRRGKYLRWHFAAGELLIHLGMSGKLRLVDEHSPPAKHDHLDLVFSDNVVVRLNDPRRFGCVVWQPHGSQHQLLKSLGVEPLSQNFNPSFLYECTRDRKQAIKLLLMNARFVVGVGNIYANEALFQAGIRPTRQSRRITRKNAVQLSASVKAILTDAIQAGGTTLKDFVHPDGNLGYFKIELNVYDRAGLACNRCSHPLKKTKLAQRQTVYCPRCQH